jgi:hypothetical protein
MAVNKHKSEDGKATTNRGKPPHKGGYSAKMKGVNPFKIYFAEGGDAFGRNFKSTSSDWKPAKSRKPKKI